MRGLGKPGCKAKVRGLGARPGEAWVRGLGARQRCEAWVRGLGARLGCEARVRYCLLTASAPPQSVHTVTLITQSQSVFNSIWYQNMSQVGGS